MKDMITNGNGNSRYLKTSLASGTTWAEALALLRAGTFPVDFNGLNNSGIAQQGSAYSKANVLPTDVCTALGLTENTAEPKDAFLALNLLENQHLWAVRNLVAAYSRIGSALGKKNLYYQNSNSPSYTSSNWVKYQVASSVSVANDGTVSLVSPTTVTVYKTSSSAGTGYTSLAGKYCKFSSASGSTMSHSSEFDAVFFCASDATFDLSTDKYIYLTGGYEVIGYSREYATKESEPISYANSQSSSTYPADGISGSYWYSYMGLIGDKGSITYGKYVGTGTKSSSNPTSLTFDFQPRLLVIFCEDSGFVGITVYPNANMLSIVNNGSVIGSSTVALYGVSLVTSWSGFTVSWYQAGISGTTSADYQLNASGYTYRYVAIG